ncbi:hypothetical protein H5410_021652 [Solanum commersonii]|uniref:Uncharacterized protein n=1 Tax=Solanum commersonii TaxID=4109 RepID=A0A9J5ZBL8_SOLCO|nr:hypothetical protein H5410_021652 [Solanum commersonii]
MPYPTHSLELSKSIGYKKSNLELSYGRRIKKTHFQLEEDELLSSSLHKTLSKLERKIQKNTID